MPQLSLSRPFQIVIVVFVLFAAIWLFVLQGHSTSNSPTAPSATTAATPATAAKTPASGSAAGATSTSGSGSSLGSLGHAIAKAHHAAAVSQQNANELERKSAQQSGEAPPTQTSSAAAHAPAGSPTHKTSATHTATKQVTKTPSSAAASPAHNSTSSTSASSTLIPSGQRSVEADLAKGNVVVLLFWDPAGTDDVVTYRAVQSLRSTHDVSVQEALASQVANYGSVTRGVQLYATPTILVINKQGQAIVLTGVQDAYSIEQAITEARSS
jgi:hypothetical protein